MNDAINKNHRIAISLKIIWHCSLLCLPLLILILLPSCSSETKQDFVYPTAHRGDVVDDFHGTMVADPYRWLEDLTAEETKTWIESQNQLTQSLINNGIRQAIEKRLTKLWDYPKYGVPHKEGDRYIFKKNDGLQNQYVYYMQKSIAGEAVPILDPNEFSDDGTVAVNGMEFSHDGTLLAYGISARGSDWQKFRIRNVDSGKEYDETLDWCKFTGIAWKHDNSGFFYNRYSDTNSVPREDWNRYNRLYWHKLGTPQSEDKLVYERPDDKRLNFAPSTSYDGKYVILEVWHGTDPESRIYYREMQDGGDVIRLLDEADAGYSFIENIGSVFYFKTDLDAPNSRVIAIDVSKPVRKNWKEIIPEQDDALASAKIINHQLLLSYKHDAHHQVKLYDIDGTFIKDIELPGLGSARSISGKPDEAEMLFGFSSFLDPMSSYAYNLETDEMILIKASEVDFDASKYVSKQIFYNSKDGTRVPLFVTHKKEIELDGNNPALLYGYGGFQSSMMPFFSETFSFWMENGGVLAVACLRGGTEYGEDWHKAGMLENKQNVFDDFIAAGEWLIDNGYTQPSRLAIKGGSNGGLLVAACMIQRPELFGAVLCGVPVIDMLRYHKFTVGHYWVGEYGNAEENPDHFKFMHAYSPLHNIKEGVIYPPTLVTTADSDNRVYPAHSLKFVAALQAADAGKNPILLRYDTKAGHGGGKPTTKIIEEQADTYAFLFGLFGMSLTE